MGNVRISESEKVDEPDLESADRPEIARTPRVGNQDAARRAESARAERRAAPEVATDPQAARKLILSLRSKDGGKNAGSAAAIAALELLIIDPIEFYSAEAFIITGSYDAEEGAAVRWIPVITNLPAPALAAYDAVLAKHRLGSVKQASERIRRQSAAQRAIEILVEERDNGRETSPVAIAALATLLGLGMTREQIELQIESARGENKALLGASDVIEVTAPEPGALDAAYGRAGELVASQKAPAKGSATPKKAAEKLATPREPRTSTSVTVLDEGGAGASTAQPARRGSPVAVYRYTKDELAGVPDDKLGYEISRRTIVRLGFDETTASVFLTSRPAWTYRGDYGRGQVEAGAAIRKELDDKGFVLDEMPYAAVAELKAQINKSQQTASVDARDENDDVKSVRELTGWIDWLTGTGSASSGDWPSLNALLVGLIKFGGRVAHIEAGVTRILGDVTGGVGLDRVTEALREYESAQRRRGDALSGASSTVTINVENNWRRSEDAGIAVPFLERLPGILGENPETLVALMGPEAQITLAVASVPMTFLQSYGRGGSATDSLKEAGWAALQAAISPIAGRYGLTAEFAAEIGATYGLGKWRGLSDREIEEQIALTLIQTGLGGGKKGLSKSTDIGPIARQMTEAAKSSLPPFKDSDGATKPPPVSTTDGATTKPPVTDGATTKPPPVTTDGATKPPPVITDGATKPPPVITDGATKPPVTTNDGNTGIAIDKPPPRVRRDPGIEKFLGQADRVSEKYTVIRAIDALAAGQTPAPGDMAVVRRLIGVGKLDPGPLPVEIRSKLPEAGVIDEASVRAWADDLANSNPEKMTNAEAKADLDAYIERREFAESLYRKAMTDPTFEPPSGVTRAQLELAVKGDPVTGERVPLTFNTRDGALGKDIGAAKELFGQFRGELEVLFAKHGIDDAVVVQLGSGTTGWSTAPGKQGKAWTPKSDVDFAIFSDQALMQAMKQGGSVNPKNKQAGEYTTLKNDLPGNRGFSASPLGADLAALSKRWNKLVYGTENVDGFDFKLNLRTDKPFRTAVPVLDPGNRLRSVEDDKSNQTPDEQ